MMLETVRLINELNIDGIKIYIIFSIKNTLLELIYPYNHYRLLTKEENINILCKELEILIPNIVVHRLTGDPKKEDLIAPLWATKKIDILNGVVKKLKQEKSYQGKYYQS